MEFNLNSQLYLEDYSKIEDIGAALQQFTDMHLFLNEKGELRGIKHFYEIFYGECTLEKVDRNGYILKESLTGITLRVFSKDLMRYLTCEPIYNQSGQPEKIIELFPLNKKKTDKLDQTWWLIADEHPYQNLETGEYDINCRYLGEDCRKSYELMESTESTERSESNEKLSESNEKLSESNEKLSESTEKLSESTERPELPLTYDFAPEITFTNFQGYNDKYEQKKEDTKEENKEEKKEDKKWEVFFRMFLRDIGDKDCRTATDIDPDIFLQLEQEYDVDLIETIHLSFTSYLLNKGYEYVSADIDFYQDMFAEVVVKTKEKLSAEIITEIENEALLELTHNNENKVIFFIQRQMADEYYSETLNLNDIDPTLADLAKCKAFHVRNKGDVAEFYFEGGLFSVKNEGKGIYSLFDNDSHFYYKHLSPHLYPEAKDYCSLPIAQFY